MSVAISTRPKSPPRSEAITKALRPQPEYCSKVLMGNWVEERQECPVEQTMFQHQAEQTTHYNKWKPESRTPDLRSNKLYGYQGSMSTILHHSDDCDKNFLSTTDLVYNHLPKPLCGPEYRHYRRSEHIYVPQPDLIKCVGNLTEWGLKAGKEFEWKCGDVSDLISTSFQDAYVYHGLRAFPKVRYPRDSTFTKSFASLLSK